MTSLCWTQFYKQRSCSHLASWRMKRYAKFFISGEVGENLSYLPATWNLPHHYDIFLCEVFFWWLMGRAGVGFLGAPRPAEILRLAVDAEQAGAESFWVAETRFTMDAVSPLAALAITTKRSRLASSAVNIYTRSASLIAVTFAVLDEVSRGRIILGLGTGSPSILERQGIEFDAPLARLKEYVEAIRLIFKGRRVDYKGRYVRLRDMELDFEPFRRDVPIYLAVTGFKALKLAGKIADGVILNVFTSTTYVERAVKIIKEGACEAGRKLGDLEVVGLLVSSVSSDGESARRSLSGVVSTYLVNFPAIAVQSGIRHEELQRIREAYVSGGVEMAKKLMTPEIINSLTVCGPVSDCVERISAYLSAGVDLPALIPIDMDNHQFLELLKV
ncbi:MAG: LLM class flavin-dependent oxidoreductase [Nitrososphaerota archaeon]